MLYTILAIALALASAITIAWGTVIRHRIAKSASADGNLRNDPVLQALGRPLWWAGISTAVIGYGLQVAALGFGTLLIVQPILVMSLMFTLPLAAWYESRKMRRREIFWSIALTIGVAVLVLLGRPTAGNPQPELSRWIPAVAVGFAVMIATTVIAFNWKKNKALLLGCVTGCIYGYVAVLSKAVVDIASHQGLKILAGSWELYGLIAMAAIGTIVQQYSFNAGALKNSLPAMTIVEPIVAFGLGYAILGEKFQVSTFAGWSGMAAALVVMITSTVVLSRVSLHPTGSSTVASRKPRARGH